MKSNIFLFHSLIASCCYFLFSFFFLLFLYNFLFVRMDLFKEMVIEAERREKWEWEKEERKKEIFLLDTLRNWWWWWLWCLDDPRCYDFFMKNLFLFDGGLFPFIYLLLLLFFLFLRIYLSFTAIFFLSPTIQVKNMSERKFMEGTITCTQLLI